MKQEIINHRNCSNLEDLLDALHVLHEDSQTHSSAVHLRCHGSFEVEVALEEAELSDGSKVHNIIIRGL